MIGFFSHGFVTSIYGGIISTFIFLILYIGGLFYKKRFYKNTVVNNPPLSINDVVLAGCLGLVLGIHLLFQGLAVSLLFLCILTLTKFILMLIKRTYNPTTPIPIGSMLCLGAFIVILLNTLGFKQICLLSFCLTFTEPSSPFPVFP
jgi:prepilin signal peptidase PulO-like enzyme (type II secretory pathway)